MKLIEVIIRPKEANQIWSKFVIGTVLIYLIPNTATERFLNPLSTVLVNEYLTFV